MKIPIERQLYLQALLESHAEIDKAVIYEELKPYFVPDPKKLAASELNRQVNLFIARQKGNDGLRTCFLVHDETGPKVINIENAENEKQALCVAEKLRKSIQRRLPAFHKANRKLGEYGTQLELSGFSELYAATSGETGARPWS